MFTSLSAAKASRQLYQLMEQIACSHYPVHIRGKKNNAFLISEEDWVEIQKSLVKENL
jgi:PHD/YefM family antitoxin component YafN of YafNO toxin-antitoxin module